MKKIIRYNNICLRVLTVACMLMASMGAWAADYVIFSNGHFFAHGTGTNITAPTTFNAASCVWTTSGSTYLKNGNYGINSDTSNPPNITLVNSNGVAWTLSGYRFGYKPQNGTRYYYLNGYTDGKWGTARTGSNGSITSAPQLLYQVSQQGASLSTPAISGEDKITSATTYNYSASAIGSPSCYKFTGETTYYAVEGGTPSTEVPSGTVSYSWTLSSNPYATVDSSTGTVNVTRLPDDDTNITLTVTATYAGQQKQVSKTITLSSSEPAGYVIYDGNNHYLGDASMTAIGSFNPNTCLWTGTDGGRWQNSAGYYLRMQQSGYINRTYTMSLNQTNSSNWDLSGTESGTTGQKLDDATYSRYVRYNGGWTNTGTSTDGGTNVVFTVLKKSSTGTDNTTPPTISAAINSAKDGVQLSHTNVTGTYNPAYEDYIFYNGTHHYWYNGSSHDQKPADVNFASTNATYTWSIVSGDQYATIDASGNLKSKGVATTEQTVRVKLTTTHAASGYSNEQTYDVKIQDYAESPVVAKIGDNHVINNVGGSLTMRGYLEGSYKPAYTKYSFLYESHYLYNGKDYGYSEPALYDDGGCVFTWSLSGEGKDYSSLNSNTGKNPVLTYNANADHDVVVTLHLTVTHPDFPSLRVESDAWDVTLYSPTIAAPVITYDERTSNVTLSVPSEGTTYYTTDGSDPKTSGTRQTYSAPFSITTSPTTIKAYSERWGVQSSVSEETVKIKLGTPTVTIDGSGAATITLGGAPAGTQFRYTTDGTDPTESSVLYDDANKPALGNGDVIKAIAVKDGYLNSDVAEQSYSISSGIRDGKVILNDYEDHTWTYYAGVDSEVDGGHYNTTYVAQGTTRPKYDAKMYSPNPRNVKITYNATNSAAVSISESETSFVYYKTLEQGTIEGQYPYQVISNPFSKRPAHSGTTYYGFAGWKIVSGGEYIQGHNDNDVLSLDEEITFVNLPYPSVNCTSAEIVFETTWTTANRTYITTNPGSNQTYTFNSGTYETNFVVINVNYTRQITISGSATIMMVEPDGSADYRTARAFSGALVPATGAANTTKIEFANWTATGTRDAYGRNLTIGRGMTMSTARDVVGSAQTGGCNQVLKIESGNYGTFYHFTANPSSLTKQWITFGNDYDRAKKDWEGNNNTLNFSGEMRGGANRNIGKNSTDEMWRVVAKSGKYLTGVGGPQSAAAEQSYYIGVSGTHNNGHRYLEIQGGYWAGNISGGMGENHTPTEPAFTFRMRGGHILGSIYGAAQFAGAGGGRTYIITGGEINGWVAAGANGTQSDGGKNNGASYVYVGGNARIDSNHSATAINRSVGGNVYGAGCGYSATSSSGEMTLGSNMVVADNAYIERGLYGGGAYGFVTNTPATNIQKSYIYITGGHVGGYTGQDYGSTTVQGGVYGGARQNKGGSALIYMTSGLVETGIYGGSNITGTMSGFVTMQINGGQVGTTTTPANIHGGGYGNETVVSQNVDITLGKNNAGPDADGVIVYGDVYGGSALGRVNGTAANTNFHTNVTMNAGYIHGSLYGGALGSSTVAANVYGPVAVTVNGGSVFNTDGTGANGSGAVYGANNINGAPQRNVTVDIYGTNSAPEEGEYALFSVYGGGNQANYTYGNGYPKVTVHGCDNSIEYVYGGGNAAAVAATDVTIYGGDKIGNVFGGGNGQVKAANVNGNTNVKIYGGTIGDVYGGSNTNGTIGGKISVLVNKTSENGDDGCDMIIDNVYGGGNKAASNVGNVTIQCTGTKDGEGIGAVYGGANQADVTGDITLNIVSGHIDNVFGGNNNSGNIDGNITVNIDEDPDAGCGKAMSIGNVFGGGNLAAYTPKTPDFPVVNILNGTLTGSVFGGGKGDPADHSKGKVTGNPQVTIGQATGKVTIAGDVYGGGDAGDVAGTPVVKIFKNCDNEIGNVYGGGNAADVTGTNVTVDGGTIGMVFGGGHGDKDAEPQKEANVNGNVVLNITGGTINKVFAGSNSKGNITGTTGVTVNKTDGSCDLHITELYGGGNEAAGNAGTIKIQNTGGADEGIGTVYGGANNADINSNIALNITGGNIGDIFGGNNNGGQVNGNITVDINWTGTGVNRVGNVYGGGNIASIDNGTARTVTVNIPNAEVSGSVFGGGKGKEAVIVGSTNVNLGTWSNTTNAIVNGDVFGGGDLAAVEGDCNITIRDCGTQILGDLYGGGNAAPVYSTNTTMWGGLVKGNVFGGGNGKDASKNANGAQVGYKRDDSTDGGSGVATTKIYGGTVGTWNGDECTDGTGGVFGGSNTNGNIRGGIALTLDQQTCSETDATQCSLKLREIYGAGNEAAYAGTGIAFDLGCVDYLEEIYGGAKAADLNADANLTITSGHFGKVFGGNNVSGKLNGSITVTVDETGCNPVIIDELYGGGNLAAYSVYGYDGTAPRTKEQYDALTDEQKVTEGLSTPRTDPVVNIISCTSIGTVFGGGYGESAVMVGNPTVNINQIKGIHAGTTPNGGNPIPDALGEIGAVFGGGNAAKVIGDTKVNVGTVTDQVSHVTGSDQVKASKYNAGANITGNVYGGGNQADVTGKTNVIVGRE